MKSTKEKFKELCAKRAYSRTWINSKLSNLGWVLEVSDYRVWGSVTNSSFKLRSQKITLLA